MFLHGWVSMTSTQNLKSIPRHKLDKDGVPIGLDLEGNPIQPLTRFKLLFGGKGQLAIANIRGTLKLEFVENLVLGEPLK